MGVYAAEALDLIRLRPGLAREVARQLDFVRNSRGLAVKPVLSRLGLTRRQQELLDFIRAYHATNGITPSYDEMMAGLGLASKSGVHRLVTALEERGHLFRIPNRARSIVVAEAA